jgi:hypothetical protein
VGRPRKTQQAKKAEAKKKRKPALLRVNFIQSGSPLPQISGKEGEVNDGKTKKPIPFETIVFNETIEAIENIIDFPSPTADVFELKGLNVYVVLEKEYFPHVLVNALKHFEKTENYEMCSRCQNLLQTIKI